VGGEYLERNVALLAPGGRLVMIASMGGAKGMLDIPSLMKKRARIIGSVLRSRSDEEKGRITQLFQERFMQQIASRQIRVVVDSVVPFAKADLAHQKMQSSEHIGKIILHVK
jgi:NADPH2:quinone reductase